MIKIIKDILHWLKDPDDVPLETSIKEKLVFMCKVLVIEILVGLVFIGILELIDNYVVVLRSELIFIDPIFDLFLITLIVPTIEEIIFRWPLKYKRNYLVRALDFIFQGRIKPYWSSFFKYFVYLMAMGFGLLHVSNFKNNEVIFYCLIPILVGNQIMGGFMLSYTRIKLGFVWGILQHGLFNLFGIIIGLLFWHNQDIIKVSNEDFDLQLTELIYINEEQSRFESDIKDGYTYSINAQDINLSRVIDSLNVGGAFLINDFWINFYFTSDEGIPNEELIELLKTEINFEE